MLMHTLVLITAATTSQITHARRVKNSTLFASGFTARASLGPRLPRGRTS